MSLSRSISWPRVRPVVLCLVILTHCGSANGSSLLATRFWHWRNGSSLLGDDTIGKITCTSLENRGSRVTVQILVGMTKEPFDVVVDTGSNAVIIPSCACVTAGFCSSEDHCYKSKDQSKDGPAAIIRMTFGSGTVDAVVVTDLVRVGKVQAKMENNLLLMVRNALRLGGSSFEGILGLGLPHSQLANPEIGGSIDQEKKAISTRGFLEVAGIGQFHLCFNQNAKGVLRLGEGTASGDALPSVGKVHWGLGLNEISVGKNKVSVGLCSPDSKESDQATACGAIPDSGTTLIMAPKNHLEILFQKICASWSRCSKASSGAAEDSIAKFLELLAQCADWAGEEGEGLNELPPINFQLEGADGTKKGISLPPSAYIVETLRQDMIHIRKHLMGIIPVEIEVPTGHQSTSCLPAFGVMEYHTESNGPVWIMGMPLFYEYRVGYDLKANPAAVTFSNEDCGTCSDDQEASLFSDGRIVHSRLQSPAQVRGPVRVPDIDTGTPL